MFIRLLLYINLFLIIGSCSSKKNIIYLQDVKDNINQYDYEEITVKPDDVLKISVTAAIPEAAMPFNRLAVNFPPANIDIAKLDGYLVNKDGFINFPSLGKIKLLGKTLNESEKLIYDLLLENKLLTNHNVEVKFLSLHFTILGEVNIPGNHSYYRNNINILEAIGLAGDLTINGERKNIRILREHNGVQKLASLDLTNSEYLKSEYFQIKPGDVIIINPNTNRVKNAGIIGNSGTLLSLLSFLVSIVLIINN
tara:strand:+ start:718 stop:1476 length:759 start_codon:yes stop_codon:yes gene_type:complete